MADVRRRWRRRHVLARAAWLPFGWRVVSPVSRCRLTTGRAAAVRSVTFQAVNNSNGRGPGVNDGKRARSAAAGPPSLALGCVPR